MFKSYDEMVAFAKGNIDAAVQAGNKFSKGCEDMSKECLGLAGGSFDRATETVKALSSVKTPSEAIQLQQKLAKENWETSVAQMKKMADLSQMTMKNAMDPLNARYKAVMETAAAAAK